MKTHRGIIVSTLMLILLNAFVFCQGDIDDYELPHEADFSTLAALPDNWIQTPGMSDQKSKTSLVFDILTTSTPFASKGEATSEPQVAATTEYVEPEPSKEPELEKADFQYRDSSSGTVCVRACLRAVLEVPYVVFGEDGEREDRTAYIPVTNNSQVDGNCGDKEHPSRLNIQWGDSMYLLKMKFEKTRSGDTDNWIATEIYFSYDTRDSTYFEDAIGAGPKRVRVEPKSEFFESPWKKSYVCNSEDFITMSSDDESEKTILRIDQIQIQAFIQPKANGAFSEGEPCESDKQIKPTSNVASVAVGATLGCLILIVIIVYAVGRRMGSITDRTGYKAVD